MRLALTLVAATCTSCRRTSLLVRSEARASTCSRCGGRRTFVAGAEYGFDDAALFTALEALVHEARISPSTAALIAAELQTVGAPWAPPDLALERVSRRLPRLRGCYSASQERGQLLAVVSMLRTIVCARLQVVPSSPLTTRWNDSGIRPRFPLESETPDKEKSG